MSDLLIIKPGVSVDSVEGYEEISYSELEHWVKNRTFFSKHLFRYRRVGLAIYSLKVLGNPFTTAIAIRLLARRSAFIIDEAGNQQNISFIYLLKRSLMFVRDGLFRFGLVKRVKYELDGLSDSLPKWPRAKLDMGDDSLALYLRTDLVFGLKSGGSVGHIAGVLNQLDCYFSRSLFLTTDNIPTVRADIEKALITHSDRFRDFRELSGFEFNKTFYNAAIAYLENKKKPSLVYQRYSIYNYSGIKLARYLAVPLVLEFNGSEVWVSKNWGNPAKYEAIAQRIETLNLHSADLVVVVSQPLKDGLIEQGVEANRILVNPNGVDPHRYSPEISGRNIRTQSDFSDEHIVLGFIGTFGLWHGAEVLAEAFGELVNRHPEYRDQVRLMMIGDGLTLPQAKEIMQRHNVFELCQCVGVVPQTEGPEYLAACDILVSPHVPNEDGSAFFGSPTKLFEYMAMGKGIVASDLDQIGEILEHGDSAWMVKPGDSNALMLGLKKLIDDQSLRERLGARARAVAVQKHSWEQHTKRIIDAVAARCP